MRQPFKESEIYMNIKSIIRSMTLALAIALSLAGCGRAATFDGSRLSNADSFELEYDVFNKDDSAIIYLEAGDALKVSTANTSGTVDITIGIEGKPSIYEGNSLKDMVFTLNISEAGSYIIYVTGHNAQGSTSFSRVSGLDADAKADTESNAAALEAFQFVLEQIAFEHVYPDGRDTGFDSSYFIEENHFALYDVNQDGSDELIVQFTTAPMAGNLETIYSYDAEQGCVNEILYVFPAVQYYTNGLIKENWSHSSALAGENYWPYNLYQYHAESGEFVLIAAVDMWDRESEATAYISDPYPSAVDSEDAGVVFFVTQGDSTQTISKSAYESWLSETFGSASPISIPYQPMTEESIKAVF